MCGIAALINFDNSYAKAIKQSLYHRGPDAQTHYQHKNLQFIHTRLSIQDIKHGAQPFKIGNYVIIFNGEIYNHLELRKNLKQYACKTLSDTETLLALYIEFGVAALDMIDGMFAFIIHDISNDKLIVGRDRLGKKPIYLYKNNKQLFIASELNVLSNTLPVLTINERAIASFLRAGFFSQELTPYNNVEEILPGHIYEVHISSLKLSKFKYFDIADQYKSPKKISHQEALIKLDSILHKSVEDRLLSSDLDVGIFLSGGIDSSILVAIASQYVKNLKTFTVKFSGGYDESLIAASTANKFGTHHHEFPVSMNLKNDIEKILTTYGEPFMDSSAIPSYYISQEAKKHVSVILNGDGADELFGGYRRYVPFANNWPKYFKYISILSSMIPKSNIKMSNYNYLSRLLTLSNKDGLDQYLSSTTDIFEDIYRFGVANLDKRMEEEIREIDSMGFSGLSKNLVLDSKFLLANDLLKKMDIATMSHSLEARSPFLSKYILEWAPKLPDHEKIKKTKTKFLLRDLSKKYLLNNVHSMPKRGFEVPLSRWVENDLKDNIYDRLNSSNAYSTNYVDPKFIKSLLNNPSSYPKEKRSKILWSLYSLEVWYGAHNRDTNFERTNFDVYINPKPIKARNKVKILLLTTGLGLGGAERVVYDICTNINKAKFEVSVIGISSQIDMLERFHENNIHTYVLNFRKNISKFFTSIIQISRHIQNHEIDIIHAHMFHTLVIATLIKLNQYLKNNKVKVIFTPHNSFHSMKIRRLILWILKPFRDRDTIFSKKAVRFFYKKSSSIIPNGVDVQKYLNNKEKLIERPFTFVVIGRLEYMKNHKFLIDQVSALKNYNFKLLIIGTGILESSLKAQVDELNLNKKIEFLGSRDDVPSILSQADCLLLPSLWEAFPIVLLEAAASNIPIITTPVGSITSFVNNENGYIVDLDDFKAAMIEVLNNYGEAKIKSTKLHNYIVSNLDIRKIVCQYEVLYESVLK